MTIKGCQKLEDFANALGFLSDRLGPRTPLRQIRLLICMAHDDAPSGGAGGYGVEMGVPERTTAADLMRLSELDRHGNEGLRFATTVPGFALNRTQYAVNARGREFLSELSSYLPSNPSPEEQPAARHGAIGAV